MTDIVSDRYDTTKVVILSGWSLTVGVCLLIISAAVFSATHAGVLDPDLKNWAGMCLGFLFGSFVGLVKDFIAK